MVGFAVPHCVQCANRSAVVVCVRSMRERQPHAALALPRMQRDRPTIVAADDTSSNVPTADLIQRFLPGVKTFKQPLTGRQSLISNARLKAVLGWQQQHHYPFD